MPTRSSPSSTPAQIEYEAALLGPVDLLAQGQVLAVGEAEGVGETRSGTSNETMTASSVSGTRSSRAAGGNAGSSRA
jgi:hypothetical protein